MQATLRSTRTHLTTGLQQHARPRLSQRASRGLSTRVAAEPKANMKAVWNGVVLAESDSTIKVSSVAQADPGRKAASPIIDGGAIARPM